MGVPCPMYLLVETIASGENLVIVFYYRHFYGNINYIGVAEKEMWKKFKIAYY